MPIAPFLGGAGAVAAGSVDFGLALQPWFPLLHVTNMQDLELWTEAEVYQAIDESLTDLYRAARLKVDSLDFIALDPVITLPARLVSVLHVDASGALKPTTVAEIEALAAGSWRSRVDRPKRWLHENDGTRAVRIWPAPPAQINVTVLAVVAQEEVTTGNRSIEAPLWVADAALFGAMAQLLSRESDGAMPEVAAQCKQHGEIYRQAAAGLYGSNLAG